MTSVVYLLGVLAVVVLIGVSIALHELGHLVPAKRFGVRCTKYMIGFGPTHLVPCAPRRLNTASRRSRSAATSR
ncbi:MAG: site-2 protease family protein [Dermatophilaceae bacterium]